MHGRLLLLLGFALFCADAASVRAATWNERVESIAISPDGRFLASGGDGTIDVWDIASGEVQQSLTGHQHTVYSLSFHPDGKLLSSSDSDGVFMVWDRESGEVLHNLTGHGKYVRAVFSPDGALLVSGDDDGLIKVWDAKSFAEVRSFNNSKGLFALSISHDGQRIIIGDSGGNQATVWDFSSGEQVAQYESSKAEADPGVLSVVFRPGTSYVVSGGNGGHLFTYDLDAEDRRLYEMPESIVGMAFSDDGRYLACTLATNGKNVMLIDFEDKTSRLLNAHIFLPKAVAFLPGTHRFATTAFNGAFKIWDAENAEVVNAFGPNTLLDHPLSEATQGVAFAENFDENERDWDYDDSDTAYQGIQHGFYFFEFKKEEGGRFDWADCTFDPDRDFTIKTSIAHLGGANQGFGLVWGLADADNYYSFNVSADNFYRVNKETDGEWENLVEWTEVPQIDRGNSVYVLTVKKTGDKMTFHANDVQLAELPFATLFGDKIGISIWKKQKIAVDWIHVYQEPEGGAQ